MEPGPPPKFWDYDSLLGELIAGVQRHAESSVGSEEWDTIFFSLRNTRQASYDIRVVLRGRPAEVLGPNAEIDQLAQALIHVLSAPPKEKWKTLYIEIRREGSVIKLR
jgi:hypothetical protein